MKKHFVFHLKHKGNLGKIQSSLNSIVGVIRGAPWIKTKFVHPNVLVSCWIIFMLKFTSQTLWKVVCYASSCLQLHLHIKAHYQNKTNFFFQDLVDGDVIKLSKETWGQNWASSFYECWTPSNTICINNNTTSYSCQTLVVLWECHWSIGM